MTKKVFNSKELLGCLSIFCSAFCFYLATTTIRWSKSWVTLDPAFFVFVRFLLGFFVVCSVLSLRRQSLKPRRYDFLIGRTLANCVAVYCFYKGVDLTTVAKANILNMTYPIFIAIFSWIFLKEQRDAVAVTIVLVAFAGVWLILSPEKIGLDFNNLWGLASGISASFAIIFLNLSRKFHDSETILFYMFGLGSVIIFLFFHDKIFVPDKQELYYLLICSGFGICGQYLLTLGFRYVTAVEGGIISSTRILLAALLGPCIASDLPLSPSGWMGAILIFGANVYLALRKAKVNHLNTIQKSTFVRHPME